MTSPRLDQPHTPVPPPDLPQFRPSPVRATTLATPIPSHTYNKARATSQPAGERIPARTGSGGPNQVETGRGSPGGIYGVIGGSRTPQKLVGGHALGNGTATRANSFSAAELRMPRVSTNHPPRSTQNASLSRTLSSHQEEHFVRSRSTSPFPTFSPASSPSASPNASVPQPQHSAQSASPPRNFSRSRSQSLAVGRGIPDRPTGLTSGPALDIAATPWTSEPVEESNMSPFTRGMPYLGPLPGQEPVKARGPFGIPHRGVTIGGWGSSAPEHQTSNPSALSNALSGGWNRQPMYSTVVGGFENNPAGIKSGTSSRRHSVSIVGGAQGRRDIFADLGMTSPPRGLGPLGFSDEELLPEQLGNALNLEIDEHRRRGVEIEVGRDPGRGRDIPRPGQGAAQGFDPLGEDSRARSYPLGGIPIPGSFGTSPCGRTEETVGAGDRTGSHDSKDSSSRSRFTLETPSSSMRPNAGTGGLRGMGISTSPPQRGRDMDPRRPGEVLGPIGSPPNPTLMDHRIFPPMYAGRSMFPSGPGPGPGPMGPPSPLAPGYPRPTSYAYGQRPPPMGGFGPGPGLGAPGPGYNMSPQQYSPTHSSFPYFAGPPAPSSPTQPHSPSFSQLSLSDLGKGTTLNTLAPNTPLYIVAFKAGRRDVYYCPDPTLLISNGDRVIVEADRGSDLGTVIYDQLTPVDVREWQEKQATAALLSGANQHQPPGMAAMSGQPQKPTPRAVGGGQLAGADLATLLAGVGSQVDPAIGLGGHGRGPLAKEIAPKRIFTKSAQGPEEQARMMDKMKAEYDALMTCRQKVAERQLPMEIVDAEYQWDRRKLTFYFKADKRVDFRELTKENFRIFKSRIWMSMVPKDEAKKDIIKIDFICNNTLRNNNKEQFNQVGLFNAVQYNRKETRKDWKVCTTLRQAQQLGV